MLDILTLDVLQHGHIRVLIPHLCSSLFYRHCRLDMIESGMHLPSKRVFILGPSHHFYLNGCALSGCKEYETPIGNLPLDLDSEQLAFFPVPIVFSTINCPISYQRAPSYWEV